MTTTQNEFWGNKVWHHLVHERLGEVLFYYLAQVRPFNVHKTTEDLNRLIVERKLGSIRVFPIFGPDDLLIRAWLHPSMESEFRKWLDQSLKGCRNLLPFAVTHIDKRWYSDESPKVLDRDLMEVINSETVREVQSDQNPGLLDKLIANRLVIQRTEGEQRAIRFFIAIELDEDRQSLKEEIAKGVKAHLDESSDTEHFSVYRGYGFCSVLITGQVYDYFRIADLINWVAERFESLGVTTYTFLVHDPQHIVGDEMIGEATFKAIRGRNLFVQSIVPEVYETHNPRSEQIERFLQDVERSTTFSRDLLPRDKRLLHDFLMGHLKKEPTLMAQTLFIYFFDLENYLRNNHQQFINRVSPPIKDLYQLANISKDSGKFLSLGDLLNLYSLALNKSEKAEYHGLLSNWQILARIRNKLAHGDLDVDSVWEKTLRDLLTELPKIHSLLSYIENTTEKKFVGTY